jgi:REP element-mobilizing transposase RayT
MLHRRSIRLKGYDYAQSGAYFVTLCAHQRACLFGEIVVGARFGKPIAGTVPTIIRSFKSAVTKCVNEIRNTPGVSIWQRNYYEHIIRNDADHSNIAEYIVNNPLRWAEDSLHPDAVAGHGVPCPAQPGVLCPIYQDMLQP